MKRETQQVPFNEVRKAFKPQGDENSILGAVRLKSDHKIKYVFVSTKGNDYIGTILGYKNHKPGPHSRPIEIAMSSTDATDWDFFLLETITNLELKNNLTTGSETKKDWINESKSGIEFGGLNVKSGGGLNFDRAEYNIYTRTAHKFRAKAKEIKEQQRIDKEILDFIDKKKESEAEYNKLENKRKRLGF